MENKKVISYLRRCLAIVPSVPVAALGVLLFVAADWGSDPLTTFEIGLSNVFNVQLGTASLAFEGIVFIFFLLVRRDLVNFGTLIWCFTIGPFMNLFSMFLNPIMPEASELSIAAKVGLIIVGSILIIISLSYYIPIGLGYQASDIFAFVCADIVHKSYGVGLMISYAILFVLGVIMGAPWGIGTLVAVLGFGKIIDWLMPIFEPFSYKIAGMSSIETTCGE
ncbi:MAG: hypothetical protein E6300_04335 [Clostridium sp.]|uniref:hypothetical protein n=1 Tax=Clostridium sp. TaxID=1506 RepID=UPI001ED0ACB0|nr:hypothetical protein [Clostridium sp.]MBS5886486.1 hypothetical protein [Clostridium sp.]MDU7147694.1 hypothetical protein [Clostridium sp.]MDU7241585.1 hypothetical protein [Clostridium sp.]